jgi:hypothetical protein
MSGAIYLFKLQGPCEAHIEVDYSILAWKHYFKQRLFKTHFYLPPRPLGGGAEPSQATQQTGFGAAAAFAQPLYSSITQARSGTATLLSSKAHISAKGTFDGWVCSLRGRDGNPVNSKHTVSAHTGTPGRHWPRREWGWMETMQTALTHYDRSPCTALTRGGRKPLQKQHTAYNGTPGHLSLQREWGWMETVETALAHIST